MSAKNNKINNKIWLAIKLKLNNMKNYVDTPWQNIFYLLYWLVKLRKQTASSSKKIDSQMRWDARLSPRDIHRKRHKGWWSAYWHKHEVIKTWLAYINKKATYSFLVTLLKNTWLLIFVPLFAHERTLTIYPHLIPENIFVEWSEGSL